MKATSCEMQKTDADLHIARLIQQRDGTILAASYLRLRGWSLDASLFYLCQKQNLRRAA